MLAVLPQIAARMKISKNFWAALAEILTIFRDDPPPAKLAALSLTIVGILAAIWLLRGA